jgi:ribosomal protein S18 acetylase RimI-like enzyme
MEIKNLGNTPFKIIINCFNESFKNYSVTLPTESDFWQSRWQLAKVDYRLSYGMFDKNKLVGFIINAIDYRNGFKIAYNTGTGVLPEYRGQRIVKQIYDYALKNLKENGITKCSLEVIKDNLIAIKSYKSIGFKICKNYKSFQGKINISDKKIITTKIDFDQLNWKYLSNQHLYSWDFHYKTIKNGSYDYYLIANEYYFVFNPLNNYLAQFGSIKNNDIDLTVLFQGIKSVSETIKINNVDESQSKLIDFLYKIELQNTVDQFEMELII